MSNTNRIRELMWNIRLWRSPPTETFIIYDESSSPSADDYLIPLEAEILLGQFILHGSIFSAKSGRFFRFAFHRVLEQT